MPAPASAYDDLAHRLARTVGCEVRADLATRALYASDASNYRVLPRLVVTPRSSDEIAAAVGLCGEAGVPLTARGAGTSIAGNACGSGVLLDCHRVSHILGIDSTARTATVEAGAILDDVNRAVAAAGLRVGPDPSTHDRCTVGGMIGNNACGSHSVRWGTTAGSVAGLTVATSCGAVLALGSHAGDAPGQPQPGAPGILAAVRSLGEDAAPLLRRELPAWPRRVSGYALDWLLPERGVDVARALVGSEGTCAVVLSATLHLVEPPASRVLLVLGFADDVEAAEAVPALLPGEPLTVEGVDAALLGPDASAVRRELLPDGAAWLFVEAGGGSAGEAAAHALRIGVLLGRRQGDRSLRVIDDGPASRRLWRVREEGSGRATRLPGDAPAWPGFEDAVVPPAQLAAYLREFHALLREHGLSGTPYGHFGEGCIHVRIGFGLETAGGVGRMEAFVAAATDLVVRHGGSLSGEHGDGRARSALLSRQFSPELLAAFRQFKRTWDPAGVLNPGIVVDAVPLAGSLRPPIPASIGLATTYALAPDHGDLRLAALRCVGVGACVSTTRNTLMCPSYRATRDERHATRGRARLLQEMIAGSLSADGWRSQPVREALDLCLSCKGCRSECPVGVDMATYKAEFLDHHYARRLRPRAHYSLGWLPDWLRLAWPAAPLVNALLRPAILRGVLARVAGIEPDRPIPPLARVPFTRQVARHARGSAAASGAPGQRVVLWPDTFTNYLAPEAGLAALRVLSSAGFAVRVPRAAVCCGLTWISTGQLGHARRVMRRLVSRPELAGTDPIVVLEPSCAATLRADLPELVQDERAVAIARRVSTLAELLDRSGFATPHAAPRRVLVQEHCHQQAVLGSAADRRVMGRCGIVADETVQGCCGLAGNFGAERGHGAISRAVASLDLLPAIGRADPATELVADGFSCRTQIAALTDRRARHLAELLADQLDAPAAPDPAS